MNLIIFLIIITILNLIVFLIIVTSNLLVAKFVWFCHSRKIFHVNHMSLDSQKVAPTKVHAYNNSTFDLNSFFSLSNLMPWSICKDCAITMFHLSVYEIAKEHVASGMGSGGVGLPFIEASLVAVTLIITF